MTKSVVSSNPAQVRCIRYNIMWYSFSVSCGIGWWFSPCSPVSSTNKTNHIDITEILLKVDLKQFYTIYLVVVTRRKLIKQWWSPPILTKRTITSRLNRTHWTQKTPLVLTELIEHKNTSRLNRTHWTQQYLSSKLNSLNTKTLSS
jgi:hypothetical protein